jgi:hypothetical protein
LPADGPTEEDELIRMTFSGIDEEAIAREFYLMPSNSPMPLQGDGAMPGEGHTNDRTEALFATVQSFDYWDALMDPPESLGK